MDNSEIFLPIISDREDKMSPLKNCIRKNYQHVRKFAKRTSTNAFRIYDHDIKEYPLAIDFYDGRFCIHLFSYNKEETEPSQELTEEIFHVLNSLFQLSENQIFWRTRIKRKKMEQYEKNEESKDFFTVLEYGIKFKINLTSYLDTGLFLDHRETRRLVSSLSKDKVVLNLFAYTCSFSVHAAIGGASFTKSVDMSNTYTSWGRDNFDLNFLSPQNNVIVRADCLKFLEEEIGNGEKYDIIIIDPPTLSRSKKMDKFFDIQTDYVSLITKSLKLLREDGVIFFSTNSRRFKLDKTIFPSCLIIDISSKTIPLDFHDKKIHYCFKISSYHRKRFL